MLESFLAVPLHFTIEFFGFLVTAGGALLVASRPGLVPGTAFNRWTVVLGLGALTAVQIAHGGSFVEGDGEQLLVAGRALGLGLILVGVVGGLGSATVAPAGFRIEEPAAFVSAGAGLLLAIMSFASAARGGPRSMRRLGIAALALAGAEILTSAEPTAKFDVEISQPYAYAGHGLKALGFLMLAAWLWSGVRSSIRTRFVASFAALLLAVVLALSTALTGVISSNVEEAELDRVGGQLANVLQAIDQDQRELSAGVDAFRDPGSTLIPSLIANGEFERAACTITRNQFVEFDYALVFAPNGKLKASCGDGPFRGAAQEPEEQPFNDKLVFAMVGSPVARDVFEGAEIAGNAERIDQRTIALASAVRVFDPELPTPIAVILAGNYIDALYLEDVSDRFGAKTSLIVNNKVVESVLPDKVAGGLVSPDTRDVIRSGLPAEVQQAIGERSFFTAFAPITGATQSGGIAPIASLSLSSPAKLVADTRQGVTETLFLVAMAVGAAALVLASVGGRRITRPIQLLTKTAGAVREGDLSARAPVGGEDEVGQLGETFNEMTASLSRMTDDLREAAREEQRLRTRIETIIESMADGLVAVDAERKVLAFNREAEKLTGISSRKAVGKSIEKILDTRNSNGDPQRLPIHALVPGSVGGVFIARKHDKPVPVAVTSAVLRNEEGGVIGGVAVIRDMTREAEIERMKSEFLSNISHELRTPLTPIKGYAEILSHKDVPPEKSKQFALGILESTARLERIVELLVDFAAMEAGRLSRGTGIVEIGPLVATVAQQWEERSPRHTVVADVKARLPKVIGDERLLRRSLDEVLDNAVKFSPQGGTITLQAKGASSNGERGVQVIIRDQGIGIDPEELGRIFTDFQQLDGSETRTYGGLGLGLAFVRRIVEAHEGSVSVDSEPSKGTTLTITIPAAPASVPD